MATPIPPEAFTSWIAGSLGVAQPVITSGFADPDGGTSAYRIVFPAVSGPGWSSYVDSPQFGGVDTRENQANMATNYSIWLRADSPVTINMWVYDGTFAYGMVRQVNLTTSWQNFSLVATSDPVTRRCSFGSSLSIPGSVGIPACTVYAYHATTNTAAPDILPGLVGFYKFDGNLADSTGNNPMTQVTANLTGVGGYWALDGNTVDSTGTNNGTANNLGSYVAGKIGQCATFNGTNSYIAIANPANFRSSTFTVSAWIKTSSTARQEVFQSWDQQSSQYNGFEIAVNNNSVVLTWGNGGSFANISTAGIGMCDGQWHHLAVVYDGIKVKIYKDGSLVQSNTTTGPVWSSNTKVRIGINEYIPATFAYPFNGNIDEVGYWPVAKEDFDIATLYNLGAGNAYPFNSVAPSITYVPGLLGQAGRFTGGLQRTSIANPANFRSLNFTVAGWVKARPTGSAQNLFASAGPDPFGGTAGIVVRLNAIGQVEAQYGNNGGGSYTQTSTNVVANGMWHHIAIRCDKTQGSRRIYVDGREDGWAGGSTFSYNANTTVSFGFDTVADVQNWGYWSRGLSYQEIQALYNFGQGLTYPFNIGGGSLPINLLSTTGSNKLVTLSFDATPVLTGNSLLPNNWTTSPELSISNATVVGDSILLTTSEQTTGKLYTLNVPSGISSQDGLLWIGPFTQTFTGVGQGPSILNIYCIDARTIDVSFSEEVYEPDALTKENYSINNGLQVFKVVKVSKTTYRLTTSKQAVGTSYTVTASNIRDIYGNIS